MLFAEQDGAESADAGSYESPWGKHPRIQLLTIEELLSGKRVDYPPARQVNRTFRKAKKAGSKKAEQGKLDV